MDEAESTFCIFAIDCQLSIVRWLTTQAVFNRNYCSQREQDLYKQPDDVRSVSSTRCESFNARATVSYHPNNYFYSDRHLSPSTQAQSSENIVLELTFQPFPTQLRLKGPLLDSSALLQP